MNSIDRLSDEDVQRSVDAIEHSVLSAITRPRKSRRRLKWGTSVLAGIALFSGGMLTAAATSWPGNVVSPGRGVTQDSAGKVIPSVFAIDCFSSSVATTSSQNIQFNQSDDASTLARIAAARVDPASVCEAMLSAADVQNAVGTKARELIAQGQLCGRVLIDGAPWFFDGRNGANGAISISNGTIPKATARGCTGVTTVSVPKRVSPPTANCAIAQNWVAVIPSGQRAGAALCEARGLQTWPND